VQHDGVFFQRPGVLNIGFEEDGVAHLRGNISSTMTRIGLRADLMGRTEIEQERSSQCERH